MTPPRTVSQTEIERYVEMCKAGSDMVKHGKGTVRVFADLTVEHVPYDEMRLPPSPPAPEVKS